MNSSVKKYNIFQSILWSFFSKDLYRDVAQNWRGTSFLYLFMLLVICWIPLTHITVQSLKQGINKNIAPLIAQMPAITFKEGTASTQEASPHNIYYPNSKKLFAVIDTSGKFTSLDQTQSVVLLTKNRFFIQKKTGETDSYDLKKFKEINGVLTQKSVTNSLDYVKTWAASFLYSVGLLFSFIYMLILALFFAAIGNLIFVNIIKAPLTFKQTLRLSVMAMTPSLILGTVFLSFNIAFPFEGVVYLFITLSYLYWSIKVNKEGVKNNITKKDNTIG